MKKLGLIFLGLLFLFSITFYSYKIGERNSNETKVIYYQCDKKHHAHFAECPNCNQ